MTDPQLKETLESFQKYINWIIMEPDGRSIRIHDIYGGKYGCFYLLEWEDTNVFFCQEAEFTINTL